MAEKKKAMAEQEEAIAPKSLEAEGGGEFEDNKDQESSSSGKIAEPHHPLENSWTFWFDDPSARSKKVAWGSSLRSVHTFSTVEDFWSIYNNIDQPSKLLVGANFHCFKHKIEPKWEDPVCANGGKWTISRGRGKSDTMWLQTLLAMTEERFDYGDEICGASVFVRYKQERISLWTRNASNAALQLSIGKQWKEFLDYNESIGFIVHEEAKRNNRSKNRYTI